MNARRIFFFNHTFTIYDHHQCKECQQKLLNFMQLLKHIADNHKDKEVPTKRAEGKDLEAQSGFLLLLTSPF